MNNIEPRFRTAMVDVIGRREAEKALQLGKMFSSEEALKVGLVDKLVPKDQVLEAAKKEIGKWIRIPGRPVK